MSVGGYCNRCGVCCGRVAISAGYMRDRDSDYCRYMSWEDGLATCPFREGATEPKKAYEYWLKACVPFPRNYGDIKSVQPYCSHTWGYLDG